jgi:hypothetical protein
MAHGSHDTGRSRVESTLDHPALIRRDSDDRADASVSDCVTELAYRQEVDIISEVFCPKIHSNRFDGSQYTYVVDV